MRAVPVGAAVGAKEVVETRVQIHMVILLDHMDKEADWVLPVEVDQEDGPQLGPLEDVARLKCPTFKPWVFHQEVGSPETTLWPG